MLKITSYISGLNDHHMRRRLLSELRSSLERNQNRSLQEFLKKATAMHLNEQLAQGVHPSNEPHLATVAAARSGPAPATSTTHILGAKDKCYRHPYGEHTNEACMVDKEICPYCRQRVGQKALQDGHVDKTCTKEKCDFCNRRGHTRDRCYEMKRQNQGGRASGGSNKGSKRSQHASPATPGKTRKVVRFVMLDDEEEGAEAVEAAVAQAGSAPPAPSATSTD